MHSDEDLIPISALQHVLYCPRRAALILLEQLWKDNVFTIEGTGVHSRAHDTQQTETRGDKRIVRGMELRSYRWGLSGKSDVVEFTYSAPGAVSQIEVIEYKRGSPKGKLDLPFHVQVAAQVFCLEEMFSMTIDYAYLYFAKAKRRQRFNIDGLLRATTAKAIEDLHELTRSRITPVIGYTKRKCDRCSLMPVCLPHAIRPRATACLYLEALTREECDQSMDPIE